MSATYLSMLPQTVEFEHPFFRVHADGCFRLSTFDHRPAYLVALGDHRVAIPFDGLRRELDEDPYETDRSMLGAVELALDFVDELHLGDALPAEVVSGEASWEPESRHFERANRRVIAALLEWHKGPAAPLHELKDLRRFIDRHGGTEQIETALNQLAVAARLKDKTMSRLKKMITALADEYAYIEALQEKIGQVERIGATLTHIDASHRYAANVVGDITPVLRLMDIATRAFHARSEIADRQIDDLPAVARDFPKARRGIRRARDTLHSRLRAWDETLEKWAPLSPQHGDLSDITPLIADLYRFLAPRYMPIDEWVAASDYSGQMRRRRRYGRIPG